MTSETSGSIAMTPRVATRILLALTAICIWINFDKGGPTAVVPYLWIGSVGAVVVGLITIFENKLGRAISTIYALLLGCCVGWVAAHMENRSPGTALVTVSVTSVFLTFAFYDYRTNLTKAAQSVMMVAVGLIIGYLIDIVQGFDATLMFAGETFMSFMIRLLMMFFGAFGLVVYLDSPKSSASQGAVKYMQWYVALALMVMLLL